VRLCSCGTAWGREGWFDKDLGLLAAEVNGDSNPDLVAATSRGVSVLYGHGDGSFHRRTYRVPEPVDVAVGDVSGDGRPDLIAVGEADDGDGFIVVLVNDGAGRFHRGAYTVMNGIALSVAAGDLNGDGLGDVVVEGLYGDFGILLATGDGRLAAQRVVPGRGGRDLTTGDFNADGRLDVALAALGPRLVRVRLGNGDGSFGPARAFGGAGDDAMTVSTADLDNDAKLDLVVTRDGGPFVVLSGNNDGTFGAQSDYPMGLKSGLALVGDFNGDQTPDVAASGDRGWSPSSVRLGAGDGTLRQRHVLPVFSKFTNAVEEYPGTGAVADFNRDGRMDIAIAASDTLPDSAELAGRPLPEWVAVLLNRTGVPDPPCVVVPVTHERLRVARRHLRNAGCRVGHVVYRYSRNTRRHRVISQQQNYGSVLPSQSPVGLVVSRGRRR
jgi:FG-GAP-like repeat